MNFDYASGNLDASKINAILGTQIIEKIYAPFITYDVVCVKAGKQAEYEELKNTIRLAKENNLPILAEEIQRYADKLIRWCETVQNTVMIPGKTDIIDKYLKASAYTAAWFITLVGGAGTIANTDTLASHAGWTEQFPQGGSTRSGITWGTTAAGSNTATTVVITAAGAFTVTGAGICSVASGTSGVLYSASSFNATRSGGAGDTLNITPTISAA